jgi:Xaa-Pro aminopeptidase
MDAGCIVHGYWSDFLRMFSVGKAIPKWKSAYRFIYESLHLCIEETQPGVPVSNLIARYEEKMRNSPYAELADGLKLSRIGHSCGLDLIELPSISHLDHTILQPGTVLTIEPCISGNDGFFMLEEDVLVTENGFEILSEPAQPELPELG